MRIKRRGSAADYGITSIELENCTIEWDVPRQDVQIRCNGVQDFATPARHNYVIHLPLVDLVKIIEALGKRGVEQSSDEIGESMRPVLPEILRLIKSAI